MPPHLRQSPEERFLAKVNRDADSGCWLWTAYIDPMGYGRFRSDGEIRAHRFAYRTWKGPIPDELVIDHICRVRHCVNPDHLRVVTSYENFVAPGSMAAAKVLRDRTVCVNGHPYDEVNTGRSRQGYRYCKACHRERSAARAEVAMRTRSEICPQGHTRRFDRSGRLICRECFRLSHMARRKPAPTHFTCGHLRAETGAPTRNGRLYCTVCRVGKRARTTCNRGHDIADPANTYSAGKRRTCKRCVRMTAARRKAENRMSA